MGVIDQSLEVLAAGASCVDYPPLARFGCDPWSTVYALLSWLAYAIASLIQAWWPLLTVAVVLALAVGALLRVAHRRRRAREAEGARFFEIIPPYQLPADGAAPLWRLVASTLAEHGRRARVALQLWAEADDGRVHAGLWVPGGVSARAISAAVGRAWHGCGLVPRSAPSVPAGPLAATEVVPAEGPWAPLVDHQHRLQRGVAEFSDEPLRAVLEAMTDLAASGGIASMQVIVSPARGTRLGSTIRSRSVAGWVGAGLQALGRGLASLLEFAVSSSSKSSASHQGTATARNAEDPVVSARRRAREAKRQTGPHLRATVRLTVAGTSTPRRARRQARELAATLAALAVDEHVTARKRVRRAVGKVAEYRHGRTFIASTRELAALWHLPHEPSRHGLPQPGVEHRKPDTGLPRLDDHRDQKRRDQQRGHRRIGDQRRDPRRSRRGDDHGHGGDHNAA